MAARIEARPCLAPSSGGGASLPCRCRATGPICSSAPVRRHQPGDGKTPYASARCWQIGHEISDRLMAAHQALVARPWRDLMTHRARAARISRLAVPMRARAEFVRLQRCDGRPMSLRRRGSTAVLVRSFCPPSPTVRPTNTRFSWRMHGPFSLNADLSASLAAPPAQCLIVRDITGYSASDDDWMRTRAGQRRTAPFRSTGHLGSLERKPRARLAASPTESAENCRLRHRHGIHHLELLFRISVIPFGTVLAYHPGAFRPHDPPRPPHSSPTCHSRIRRGLGYLDWVPAFPFHALRSAAISTRTALYVHADRGRVPQDWNTLIFQLRPPRRRKLP